MNETTPVQTPIPTMVIEHNIPIPERGATKRGSGITKTLRELSVGDSFCIPYLAEGGKSELSRVRNSVNSCARSINMKIVCRQVEDNKMRVWRVA